MQLLIPRSIEEYFLLNTKVFLYLTVVLGSTSPYYQ